MKASHDSHNAPTGRYRQPVDRLNQRRGSADKINGSGGVEGHAWSARKGDEEPAIMEASGVGIESHALPPQKEKPPAKRGKGSKHPLPAGNASRPVASARTSLNPAAAWPFTRSEPESDQEWRNNAPEAAF